MSFAKYALLLLCVLSINIVSGVEFGSIDENAASAQENYFYQSGDAGYGGGRSHPVKKYPDDVIYQKFLDAVKDIYECIKDVRSEYKVWRVPNIIFRVCNSNYEIPETTLTPQDLHAILQKQSFWAYLRLRFKERKSFWTYLRSCLKEKN